MRSRSAVYCALQGLALIIVGAVSAASGGPASASTGFTATQSALSLPFDDGTVPQDPFNAAEAQLGLIATRRREVVRLLEHFNGELALVDEAAVTRPDDPRLLALTARYKTSIDRLENELVTLGNPSGAAARPLADATITGSVRQDVLGAGPMHWSTYLTQSLHGSLGYTRFSSSRGNGINGSISTIGAGFTRAPSEDSRLGVFARLGHGSADNRAGDTSMTSLLYGAGINGAYRLMEGVTLDTLYMIEMGKHALDWTVDTARFETITHMAAARLTGSIERDAWRISPSARGLYVSTDRPEFTSDAGVRVSKSRRQNAQVGFTIDVSRAIVLQEAGLLVSIHPHVRVGGTWLFHDTTTSGSEPNGLFERGSVIGLLGAGLRVDWGEGYSIAASTEATGNADAYVSSSTARFTTPISSILGEQLPGHLGFTMSAYGARVGFVGATLTIPMQ